uniref:Uncharacterized protein n=1 Tax=viral metagenome TaxID=1070528 RepID=A0A6C0C8X8_9ZZZZ
MYCVYQKEVQNGIENIISNIKSSDAFVSTVRDIIDNIYKIKYVVAENADHLVTNNKCEDGFYLLCLDNQITLTSRKTTVRPGYIYNSNDVAVETVYLWKMIPFKLPFSSEITEVENKIIISDDESPVISYENSCEGYHSTEL